MVKNRKRQRTENRALRAVIQGISFFLVPSAFTAAFAGVKYLFTQIGAQAQVENTAFMVIMLSLFAYTIIAGRFFCGYCCAFGTLGDAVYALSKAIQKKIKKKCPEISPRAIKGLSYLKYEILLAVIVFCSVGIWDITQGMSPWDVFSRVLSLDFNLVGYGIGIGLFVFILIGMAVKERFFCQFLCPLGAVFSLLPILPTGEIKRDRPKCLKGCAACEKNCPVNLEITQGGLLQGECIQCGRCLDYCPKSNIRIGTTQEMQWHGNEWGIVLLKIGVFWGMCFALGLMRIPFIQ